MARSMSDELIPGIHWKSRQGTGKKQNSDAAAVLRVGHTTLAIVVDGFGIDGQGGEFGAHFAQNVIDVVATKNAVDAEALIVVMRQAHETLRRLYIPQKFCFAALLIREDINIAWVIGSGDCRIGRWQSGKVEWLNTVHSLACGTEGGFEDRHLDSPWLHRVTRWVGPRFDAPDVVEIGEVIDVTWTLATDGYWIGLLRSGEVRFPGEDDTSVLWLSPLAGEDLCDSDAKNLYVRRGC
jgi:serine/threonine protein phosphatase PrpC